MTYPRAAVGGLLLKIGLTGAIASGKSLVGGMFVSLGAHLIKADEISHQLIQPGQSVYEEVVRAFGREILNADGRIDRSRLANSAFSDADNKPSRVEELNKIIHPEVVRRQKEWMKRIGRQDPKTIAIVEAALIIEAGAVGDFDRMVVVTCRPEQRIERWARRTGVPNDIARKEVERRMAAQLPEEDKVKIADHVIDNSGTVAETELQVRKLFDSFKPAT
ncbi:MAG: dephospho-CoA kinase [Acidobacteriota bacterium]|nr:dephospho-CoA kinase [Acidobacteriota bacterium]